MKPNVRRSRGFAIVSAIFILVVLAALGAFILAISTSQQVGSAQDVQGVHAYHAARSGLEWGMYRQLRDGSCPGAGAQASFQTPAATHASFTVTVICVATADTQGGPTLYTVQATACNEPNVAEPRCPNLAGRNLYVERRLQVSF